MSDNTPRRPVRGSRPSSSAPRKIAGRSGRPDMPEVEGPASDVAAEAAQDEIAPSSPPPVTEERVVEELPALPADSPADGVLSQPRTTAVLAGLLAALLVASLVLFLVGKDDSGSSDDARGETFEFDPDEEFDLPDQPITVPFVDARNAGEAATNAVVDILTVNWKTYDEHFEGVQARMTQEFAEEYADSVEDTRDKFISSKADYQFEVAGQSVVSATEDEVVALLFLNQYVFKGAGADRTGPDVYQVRVVVTAVPEGDEWLVQELEAL